MSQKNFQYVGKLRRVFLLRWTPLFIFIFSLSFGQQAYAYKYKKDQIHLSASYTQYDDVRLADGTDVVVEPSIDIEAGVRFRRLFRTFLFAAMATDNSRTEYGLGLRVDLPGFFLLDAKIQDFIRKGMQRPINTSFYLTTAKAKFTNPQGALQLDTLSVRYGLSFSWFPIEKQNFYMRLEAGGYSVGGNAFLTYGLGLGMAF